MKKTLDRLVAEKIMGIKVVRKASANPKYPRKYQLVGPHGRPIGRATGFFGWGWHASSEEAWAQCPRFSSEISAAWTVWERLARESEAVFMRFLTKLCVVSRTVVLSKAVRWMTPGIICKAALKTKGVALRKAL